MTINELFTKLGQETDKEKRALLIKQLATLPSEELALIKKSISAKQVSPELIALREKKATLEASADVVEYIKVLAEIKALGGHQRAENLPTSVKHDEKYKIIVLADGTKLDTDVKGWLPTMKAAGYSMGQVQMVIKGKGEVKNHGKVFKSTL